MKASVKRDIIKIVANLVSLIRNGRLILIQVFLCTKVRHYPSNKAQTILLEEGKERSEVSEFYDYT